MGTGGAIRNALSLIKSEQVLVLNGDSFVDFSIFQFFNYHKRNNADVTILLSSGVKGHDYGNVELSVENKIISFHEKINNSENKVINAGVYCIEKI